MPQYKFTYFSSKALGEAARLLFAYGKQEYEDVVIPYQKWSSVKPTLEFGQLPVLEIDGRAYTQSTAIGRYLGRKFGIAGNTLEEDLEIDQIVDFFIDIRAKAMSVRYEKDEKVKAQRHEENSKTVYPPLLTKLDDIIGKNNGHLALGRLTWADFLFTGHIAYLRAIFMDPELDKHYPNFARVVQNVETIPQVQEYIKNAPPREFNH